jgi:hypothetical protein
MITKSLEYSISSVDHGGIRDWQADGSKGIWIQAAAGDWYYAKFSSPCTQLPHSTDVRFVPEPTGDLSRWSSIRLSDSATCFFRTLQPSVGPPKKIQHATPSDSTANDKTSGVSLQARPLPLALDLTQPTIDRLLTPAEMQALFSLEFDATDIGIASLSRISDELSDDDQQDDLIMQPIVVQGSSSQSLPQTPCGLASLVWSLAHPADAWHIVAPVSASLNIDACLKAASGF